MEPVPFIRMPERLPVVIVDGADVTPDLDTVVFDVATGRLSLMHRGHVTLADDAGVQAFLAAPAEAGWDLRG